tara:strand:+ start:491 stop:1039 length:549 start_codon:yes stop_codon:yes gene_type:complete
MESMNANMVIAGVKGINKVIKDPVTKENVLSVTFLRENGELTVRCKSVLFHKYFKNQSKGAEYGSDGNKWNRLLRRNPVTERVFHRTGLTNDEYMSIRNWGIADNILFQNENGDLTIPHISWIRAKELDVGIKVVLCNTPIDPVKFNLYCDLAMKSLSSMYRKYMTKKQSKGKITTKLESLQ